MGIIRRIKKVIIGRNPGDNTMDDLGGTGEIHDLSDLDGSLESTYFEEKYNQHCGCFGPPGGRCSECGAISCLRCHQHCGGSGNPSSRGCGKPLCREHSYYISTDDGRNLPFCKRCRGKISRKEYRHKVGNLLLSPFIELDEAPTNKNDVPDSPK